MLCCCRHQVVVPTKTVPTELSEIKLSVDVSAVKKVGAPTAATEGITGALSRSVGAAATPAAGKEPRASGAAPTAAAGDAGGEEGGGSRHTLVYCLWAANVSVRLLFLRAFLLGASTALCYCRWRMAQCCSCSLVGSLACCGLARPPRPRQSLAAPAWACSHGSLLASSHSWSIILVCTSR